MKCLALGGFALLMLPRLVFAATFTPLGDLPGGNFSSVALGVSADGAVVVGAATVTSGNEAFRWTLESGMLGLGDLSGGVFRSLAEDVSADGMVVVGQAMDSNGAEGFRWTIDDGMTSLGSFPGRPTPFATGVSADGAIVVGFGNISAEEEVEDPSEAFRWTSSGALLGLGHLSSNRYQSEAADVSDDGFTVVGGGLGLLGWEAFRWTSSGGMVGLGDLSGSAYYTGSYANAVSADGAVVVGKGRNATNRDEAFRWTSSSGMVGLGYLASSPWWAFSEATGVSADGAVVVGVDTYSAFVWTQSSGMQRLVDVLSENGASGLLGWTLHSAMAVSSDGNWVVGYGSNPTGDAEAFLANISPDSDGDNVLDAADNCTRVVNPSQCDSDGDGYGNHCDGDLTQNGFTNAQDTVLFRNSLGAATPGPTYNIADLNCNGFVNAQDTVVLRQMLGKPPGPSGLAP